MKRKGGDSHICGTLSLLSPSSFQFRSFPRLRIGGFLHLLKTSLTIPGNPLFFQEFQSAPVKEERGSLFNFLTFSTGLPKGLKQGLLKRTSARIIESGKPLPMPFPGKSLLAYIALSPCGAGNRLLIRRRVAVLFRTADQNLSFYLDAQPFRGFLQLSGWTWAPHLLFFLLVTVHPYMSKSLILLAVFSF